MKRVRYWKMKVSDLSRPTSTNTLSVVSLSEQTVDTTDWECETGLGRSAEDEVST